MKKLLGLALLAGAATAGTAGTAYAEPEFSGNVALTTDYVFRGVSQSAENPAIQGGFDYANGIFYAGTWGSSIDFGTEGTLELDVYAGVTPEVGPFTLDLGIIAYFYPGLSDDASEADMVEFKAGASIDPMENLNISGALYYSPEFTFDGGDSLYAEIGATLGLTDMFSVSGSVGNQSVDTAGYYGIDDDSYTTWNLGGTASAYGFDLDLRYFDSDFDDPTWESLADGRVVLTVSRAL